MLPSLLIVVSILIGFGFCSDMVGRRFVVLSYPRIALPPMEPASQPPLVGSRQQGQSLRFLLLVLCKNGGQAWAGKHQLVSFSLVPVSQHGVCHGVCHGTAAFGSYMLQGVCASHTMLKSALVCGRLCRSRGGQGAGAILRRSTAMSDGDALCAVRIVEYVCFLMHCAWV